MRLPLAASLLCLLPALSASGEEVKLADGRVYTGTLKKQGKRTRVDAEARWIDVPSSQLQAPQPEGQAGPDPKPWEARLRKLGAAAALAKEDAAVLAAEFERTRLTPAIAGRLAKAFPAGPQAPLPKSPTGIREELARFRAARRFGRWLSPKTLLALDLTLVAKGEKLLERLLAAAAKSKELEDALDAITNLGLDYATWEALVRGGAGVPRTSPEAAPKGAIRLALPGGTESSYVLRVPKGLKSEVAAPVIVALHGQGDSLRSMLRCWSRFAEQGSFLLISVEYAVTGQEGYHHSFLEQSTILGALEDLSRRYLVDMNRVYVTGHSMGGHAAWDTAFSHPDRFAGLIPLISSHFAFDTHYRRNSRLVPVYCIQGENDVWTERCRKQTKSMIDLGADVTYVEYKGRGHEGFYEELPWVGPWMAARRRDPYPKRFEVVAGRPSDFRRFWVELEELKIRLFAQAPTSKVPKRHVATLSAKVEGRNTLRIDCKAATRLSVYLSDQLLDLDREVRLRVNRKVRFKGRVKRSLRFMLRDFLRRGDREALYSAVVEIEGL